MSLKPLFSKNTPDEEIFQKLKKDVFATVKQLEPRKRTEIVVKSILFPLAYVSTYVFALTYAQNTFVFYACYFLLGLLLVLNFLNLIHEAVHQTLFKRKWINDWYVHFFDLMGANSFIWKIRHRRLHHNYPNVMGWDSDFEQSSLARVFPHGSFSKMHKYQHIYLPLIYPLYLFNWLLVRDFIDFFNRKKLVWKVTTIPRIEYIKLFVFKFLFLFYTIALPVIVSKVSWGISLTAFIIMLFTASVISLLVLLSPHANTESEFPMPDEKGKMPSSWFIHQLSTTNDVTQDNWFTRYFMGCFNFHIAHHLFPSINHVYYPEVTAIIEQYAKEYNLPYRKFPIGDSLVNHYRLLKNNAFHENIFEETM